MPTVCLDTNVLLYAAIGRKDDPEKWRTALALLERGDISLPVQALAEFYAIATGPKYRLDRPTANFWMERLVLYPTTELDPALVLEGIILSQRYLLSYWDGAILAACHRCSAGVLFSEDMNHRQFYGSVQVINPFLEP